jgi:hypothetical protein
MESEMMDLPMKIALTGALCTAMAWLVAQMCDGFEPPFALKATVAVTFVLGIAAAFGGLLVGIWT